MPELPEVEVAARNLRRWSAGHAITAVDAEATRVLRPGRPADLRPLVGARVESVARIGKHLLITCSRNHDPLGVLSHLGMTGKWLRRKEDEPAPPHSRLRLHLDDGRVLHYCDVRLFGRFRLVPGARFDEVVEVHALGPDPLTDGIDRGRLRDQLRRTRQSVKLALMDQRLLPGVGNIHASEALFRAGIDPRRPASSMSDAEADRIATGVLDSIRDTLADYHRSRYDAGDGAAVAYVEEGAPNPFRVYGREGERCPRCERTGGRAGKKAAAGRARSEKSGKIGRVVIGGRSTYFCPRCQR